MSRKWQIAQKGGTCLTFLLPAITARAADWGQVNDVATVGYRLSPGGRSERLNFNVMGITMKKTILSVAAMLAIGVGAASAADMPVKVYKKAPPVVAFDPWDIAFGSAIMNDYVFRGVTQSNHKPSVAAYFEPRYNITKDLQLYVGTLVREHLVHQPRRGRSRHLRRYPPDLRRLRLRLRCLGLPLSGRALLASARPRRRRGMSGGADCAGERPAERQRHEEGCRASSKSTAR